MSLPPHLRGAVAEGGRAALPICLGYLPVGLAFGMLAREAGLAPWQAAAMSVLVFAGSAQFTALLLLGHGAGVASVVSTTFVVNLRHLLMSSAIAPYLRRSGGGFLALFGHGVTDETFAVNLTRFRDGEWSAGRAATVNWVSQAAWAGSSAVGALAGQLVPRGALGIDYALPAMFLCLLVLQVRRRAHLLVAALSGALALAVHLAVPGTAYVLVGSLTASLVGLVAMRRGPGTRP